MKLITLNTWGGRALHPLMHFLKTQRADTDIFCLQEVFHANQSDLDNRHKEEYVHGDLFNKISSILVDFQGFFAAFDDLPTRQSLAIFVRRDVKIDEVRDFLIYEPEIPLETGSKVFSPRKLQYAKVQVNGVQLTIINLHGLWNAGPKTDTPDRLKQSQAVREFLLKTKDPKILCGDFNLLPETESLKILEEGMRNLVKDNNIQSTRTVLYRHYDNPQEPNFADYILVSPGVKVKKFEVLPHVVSDHSPLCMEFEVVLQ